MFFLMNRYVVGVGATVAALFLSSSLWAAPHGGGRGGAPHGSRAIASPHPPHGGSSHIPNHHAPSLRLGPGIHVGPGGVHVDLGFHGGPGRYVGPGGPHHPPYGWYHGHWSHPGPRPWPWWGPAGWFSAGLIGGAVIWDAPWRWGYWPYYNPYCVEVVVIDGATIDYSRPVVAAPEPQQAATTAMSATDQQVAALLESARAAFAGADYSAAMTLVNQSIAKKPTGRASHEFRSLILFATGKYRDSAAAAYAVLAAGPGWDWATLAGFYPNVEVYTAQLRALERHRNEHQNLPEVRFLLAYHYMTCGHDDAAAVELKEAVRLNPKDQLAAQLLAGIAGTSATASPHDAQPAETIETPSPVEAAKLVGQWSASREDGSSFALTLTASTYSWKYTQNGKSQEFNGGYTFADNLLILKQNGNPVMIGQVSMPAEGQLRFKLAGDNPNDPGLLFSRK